MKEHQKNSIENYVNSYNKFDINGMTKDLKEDIVFKNISNGKIDLRTEGLGKFKKQAELAKQYFTKRKQIIKSWKFKGSKVIVEIDYQGVLTLDLPNGLKAGDTMKLQGVSEFEFEDRKIKKITDKS